MARTDQPAFAGSRLAGSLLYMKQFDVFGNRASAIQFLTFYQ